jgi:peptidoglycan/LPS O-acetylase OafA/YrhL
LPLSEKQGVGSSILPLATMNMLILKIFDISQIKRISFRQDINGLRAIAVLAVVFYHAELELFKGGWLGVDIFFVISGYLISNIIISELNEGTFTFKNFYLRRVRRILPALFSTLLLTIPFAYFFLTPKAMKEYIESLIASVFFFANYQFMNLDFYVAESTKLMPLLHTWSLAIEEQYYLLFPLFAFIIYKYFKKYFTFFIGLITVGSLYLNTLYQSTEKFYKLEFRIWELLFGVLVMILSSNLKIRHLEKIGLPLMLFPIFYFGEDWIINVEPKLLALIGISFILFSNTDSSVLTKVLSYKIISIIGLSSYSIYLLHQPIFAFFRIYYTQINWKVFEDSQLSNFQAFIALILTFTLSLINYKIIEIYFIKKPNYKLIFLILFFLIVGTLFLNATDNSSKFYSYTVEIEKYTANYNGNFCHDISSVDEICSFNPNENKKVILLGDSQARELGYLLSKKLENYNLEIITGDNCLFLLEKEYPEYCTLKSNDKSVKDYVASQSNTIFIYSGYLWNPRYDYLELDTNIPKTITQLFKNQNYLIAIEQIPNFPFDPIQKLNRVQFQNYVGNDYSYWKNQKLENEQFSVYKNINSDRLYLISPEESICNNLIINTCVAAIDDLLFYRDDNHLTIDGVNLFINKIIDAIDLIDNK